MSKNKQVIFKCLLCIFTSILIAVTVVACVLPFVEEGAIYYACLLMVVFVALVAVEITLIVVLSSLGKAQQKDEQQKKSEDKIAELLTKIYKKYQ